MAWTRTFKVEFYHINHEKTNKEIIIKFGLQKRMAHLTQISSEELTFLSSASFRKKIYFKYFLA